MDIIRQIFDVVFSTAYVIINTAYVVFIIILVPFSAMASPPDNIGSTKCMNIPAIIHIVVIVEIIAIYNPFFILISFIFYFPTCF